MHIKQNNFKERFLVFNSVALSPEVQIQNEAPKESKLAEMAQFVFERAKIITNAARNTMVNGKPFIQELNELSKLKLPPTDPRITEAKLALRQVQSTANMENEAQFINLVQTHPVFQKLYKEAFDAQKAANPAATDQQINESALAQLRTQSDNVSTKYFQALGSMLG